MNIKIKPICVIAVLMQMLFVTRPCYSWLIYHKPAFKGKIIDANSKQPINGAVVVVVYERILAGLGPGWSSFAFHAKETTTDSAGVFRISSYTTIIQPFSFDSEARFIIFKPRYNPIVTSWFNLNGTHNIIAAIGPSEIGYLATTSVDNMGRTLVATKMSKKFPEGLIYSVSECESRYPFLKKRSLDGPDYYLFPYENARTKLVRLDIPLDCPDNVLSVPHVDHTHYNFKNEVEEKIRDSFVVIKLTKLDDEDLRKKVVSELDSNISGIDNKLIPIYTAAVKKEKEQLDRYIKGTPPRIENKGIIIRR